MIKVHVGNLLDVKYGIIVHGCNAHGVMGSGVAKAIRDLYPVAYHVYARTHAQEGLELGQVVYHTPFFGLLIANAITQFDFGGPERHADYYAIRLAFRKIGRFAQEFAHNNGFEIHFPLIGAGLANGDWAKISKIIDETIPDNVGKNLWVLNENFAQSAISSAPEIHVRTEVRNEKDHTA